jgi:hypothetical protein
MKLKYHFVFQPIGDIYMGVPVGDSAKLFHGMMQLNEVGYDIVSLMTEEISREEIVDKILEMYDIDRDSALVHVNDVIAYLEGQGVLE